MSLPWFTLATRLNTLLEVVPGGVRKLTDSCSWLKSLLAAATNSISIGGFGWRLSHTAADELFAAMGCWYLFWLLVAFVTGGGWSLSRTAIASVCWLF